MDAHLPASSSLSYQRGMHPFTVSNVGSHGILHLRPTARPQQLERRLENDTGDCGLSSSREKACAEKARPEQILPVGAPLSTREIGTSLSSGSPHKAPIPTQDPHLHPRCQVRQHYDQSITLGHCLRPAEDWPTGWKHEIDQEECIQEHDASWPGSSRISISSSSATVQETGESDCISSMTSEDEDYVGPPAECVAGFEAFDRLTFAPTCNEPDLVRFANGTHLLAATPLRLVAQITSPALVDYELLSDFFLTYRAFMPPLSLFQYLECRLRWALARTDEVGKIVRVRTFVALRHWVLNYFPDDFLTDYSLRELFCQKINSLYVAQRANIVRPYADTQVLVELKRCWFKTCSLYWDQGRGCRQFKPDDAVQPGGIPGVRDAEPEDKRHTLFNEADCRPVRPKLWAERLLVETDSFVRYQNHSEPTDDDPTLSVAEKYSGVLSTEISDGHSRKLATAQLRLDGRECLVDPEVRTHIEASVLSNGHTNPKPNVGSLGKRAEATTLSGRGLPVSGHNPSDAVPRPLVWGTIRAIQSLQNGDLIKGRCSPPRAEHVLLEKASSDERFHVKRSHSITLAIEPRNENINADTSPMMRKVLGSVRRAIENKLNSSGSHRGLMSQQGQEPGRSKSWSVRTLATGRGIPAAPLKPAQEDLIRIDLLAAEVCAAYHRKLVQQDSVRNNTVPSMGSKNQLAPLKRSLLGLQEAAPGRTSLRGDPAKVLMPRSQVSSSQTAQPADLLGAMKPPSADKSKAKEGEPTADVQTRSPRSSSQSGEIAELLRASRANGLHDGSTQRSSQRLPQEADKEDDTMAVYSLRRKPGGALKEVERVADLKNLRTRRSLDSLVSRVRTDSLASFASTGLLMRSRPPSLLPRCGPSARPSVGKLTTSLLETLSIAPLLRPSFEAKVAQLATLPDEGDEGGVETALLKLEGIYHKYPATSICRPEALHIAHGQDGYSAAQNRTHTSIAPESSLCCVNPDRNPETWGPEPTTAPRHYVLTASVRTVDFDEDWDSTMIPGDPAASGHCLRTSNRSHGSDLTVQCPASRPRAPSLASADFESLYEQPLSAHPLRHSAAPSLSMLQALRMTPPPASSSSQLRTGLDSNSHGPDDRNLGKKTAQSYAGASSNFLARKGAGNPWTRDTAILNRHLCFILAVDADVLAQQCTLIEMDAMAEVDWKSLVDLEWTNRTVKADNWVDIVGLEHLTGIELAIARFNIVVRWAKSEIVMTQDIEERAATISKYIHVAELAKTYQNFATMAQLAIALTSEDIIRLRKTWELVPDEDLQILGRLEQLISPFGDFERMRTAMDSSSLDRGFIPFLVVYTRDLVANADRRPARLPAGSLKSSPDDFMINFERYRYTATIVKKLLRFQDASARYDFELVPDVCQRCLWMASIEDEEIQWRAASLT